MLPHHGEPAAVPPGARARALGPRGAPAAVQLHAGDTRVGVLVPRHAHHHVLPRTRALHGHGRHGPEGAGDGHLVGGELPADVVRGAAQRAVTLQITPDIFFCPFINISYLVGQPRLHPLQVPVPGPAHLS